MAQSSQDLLRSAVTAVKVMAGAGALAVALSTSLASLRTVQAAEAVPASRSVAGQTTATTGDGAVTACGSDVSA